MKTLEIIRLYNIIAPVGITDLKNFKKTLEIIRLINVLKPLVEKYERESDTISEKLLKPEWKEAYEKVQNHNLFLAKMGKKEDELNSVEIEVCVAMINEHKKIVKAAQLELIDCEHTITIPKLTEKEFESMSKAGKWSYGDAGVVADYMLKK